MPDIFDFAAPLAILGGAFISSNAAGKAADVQANAANQAAQAQLNMYNTSRADLAPFRDVGSNALYQLAALGNVEYAGAPGTMEDRAATGLSRFKTSPGYQFRLSEGLKALDRSASSRGRLMSGSTIKGAEEYGQGLASQEYDRYYNRISNLAGVGQTATSDTGQLGRSAANSIGNAYQTAGAARASGYGATANAMTSGVMNNLAYLYGRQS